jgi:putative phosphoribosyl transferase
VKEHGEMLFVDRADAGRQLARRLLHLRGTDAVVVALPRGGVPVAAEVARELRAPLDVIVVRKLGVPFQPECGFGAIGEGGARTIDERVVRQARLTRQAIASVEAREQARLDRRLAQLRGGRLPVPLAGRTAVVVDDGIATGSTARAACLVARARGASRVIVAVPVGAAEAVASLRRDADEVICLHTPAPFVAIGDWYQDFSQVADPAVADMLGQAVTSTEPRDAAPDPAEVTVDAGDILLPGSLVIPSDAGGLAVFVHGSGSTRHSPRNQFVAAGLNRAGLGTLLVDLLTPDEELSRANVFNVALLAARLAAITRWLGDQPGTAALPVGYFGASTGTAAALAAATARPRLPVTAIVSRSGRPDLVGGRLALVRTPTLLIVGGADRVVLDLNQRARTQLKCESGLAVVPGATHLFPESGALSQVTDLATGWFGRHFAQVGAIAAAA